MDGTDVWGPLEQPQPQRRAIMPALALALPGVVLGVALLWHVLAPIANRARGEPEVLSMADVIVSRDGAEAAYRILRGTDPNRASALHRGSRSAGPVALTPLEAAVVTGEAHLVQMLLDYGAVMDRRNIPRLWCFAEAIGEEPIGRFLLARTGASPPNCAGVAVPWKR
jgi:hypothetical protein